VVIGDAESDMLAGRAIGARTFRVGPPPLPSLLDVARSIVS
jgi:phosphoglycolate phosphatase-like HAD superfamily hydrolase